MVCICTVTPKHHVHATEVLTLGTVQILAERLPTLAIAKNEPPVNAIFSTEDKTD